MISLSQLRAFVAVARHRHFTRAAEDISVSQPSISYQVRRLERALRTRLVDVTGRHVRLTDAGERLASWAVGWINELEEVEEEIRQYGRGVVGQVRLGATRAVGGYALPSVLVAFRAAQPGVEVQLTIDNLTVIEELLVGREIELAVVEAPPAGREWTVEPLRGDRLVLIAPPDHPITRPESVDLEQLRGQSFVLREPGAGTRARTEQLLAPLAGDFVVAMELSEPEAIIRAVAAGAGLSIISEEIADLHLRTGAVRLVEISGIDLVRPFHLVMPRRGQLSPTADLFRRHLIEQWRAPALPHEPRGTERR